jgi:cell division transport system permease protein
MRVGLIASEVAHGLRRNLSMVVSVILVTFISLSFVGTAILLQAQIGQMKGYWYDRAQVAVYMCTALSDTGTDCALTEATGEQKANVEAQLTSPALAPLIDSYEFESHDEAYERYQEQFGETDGADFVTPEFLNEVYWVNLKDPTQADALVESLAGVPGVEEVQDQRAYLDPIFTALNAASFTAIGIAVLMLVAAVLLISTTIRLSAFSRRRELGIMRLVGASNRFIQTPFILEGVVAAFIGSVLAAAAVIAVVRFFVEGYLEAMLRSTTAVVGVGDAVLVAPVLIVIGTVLAAASAGFAIHRYLKV